MKICPNCNQRYVDNDLNFCLTDGGMLVSAPEEDAAPTILLDRARTTNQNWSPTEPEPFSAPWQNQPLAAPQPQYMAPTYVRGHDQTLPTLSLVLGILSLLLICCYGGFYFGIAAMIVGFIGISNVDKNPETYGGKGLAVAGMITGGISLIIAVLMIIATIAR